MTKVEEGTGEEVRSFPPVPKGGESMMKVRFYGIERKTVSKDVEKRIVEAIKDILEDLEYHFNVIALLEEIKYTFMGKEVLFDIEEEYDYDVEKEMVKIHIFDKKNGKFLMTLSFIITSECVSCE